MSVRAVFDANVLIAALISPTGPGHRLLNAVRSGDIELVVCPSLFTEFHDVAYRPKIRAYITEDEADRFIHDLIALAERRPDPASPPPVTRDPADDYLIALAQSAEAVLVTGDHDLLDLHIDDLEIVSPRAFLDSIDQG
ncbi:MAG: putative toxin-antitoxin system toxin component, PIN family [Acidimicrobiia bacterium]|nr:putative toxin-antitoxin system toxin component, PIN family [Acidimicrobiia bacterium]